MFGGALQDEVMDYVAVLGQSVHACAKAVDDVASVLELCRDQLVCDLLRLLNVAGHLLVPLLCQAQLCRLGSLRLLIAPVSFLGFA